MSEKFNITDFSFVCVHMGKSIVGLSSCEDTARIQKAKDDGFMVTKMVPEQDIKK